jgi:hypothetical protein
VPGVDDQRRLLSDGERAEQRAACQMQRRRPLALEERLNGGLARGARRVGGLR